jgi:hypothetical protein
MDKKYVVVSLQNITRKKKHVPVAYKALGHGRSGADAVGANSGQVEGEGAWYDAKVEAQLLE